MRFEPAAVDGVHVVELDRLEDERGFFARAFCSREFREHGLVAEVVQANLSHTIRAGTIRGLHYQAAVAAETKLFRCIRGEAYVVAVDARPASPTAWRWTGAHLSADNHRALYVPAECATGYQALTDHVELLYLVSGYYTPAAERGIRPDDPAIGIEWPLPVGAVSEKDASWPLLDVPSSHLT
jgi:dTDP-4-dehydrorhamnose 3,5-epimerase